ncbi:hypothetical protein [Lactococcus lactis]|uniref:hypothetical protein n=2 Tax=Lactococcus lactis TaxID=1358 RepID=UPI00211D9F6E|nr:hypothetical protein [Lactococcus lactis]
MGDLVQLWNSDNVDLDTKFRKDNLYLKVGNDTIEQKNVLKGDSMHQETYSKNEIDLKFESISNKMDSKFELLSQKLDSGFSNQSLQMNNSLLEFKQALKDESEKERKEREQAKKESVRWYIGIVFTIIGTGIAIAGTIAAFLALT